MAPPHRHPGALTRDAARLLRAIIRFLEWLLRLLTGQWREHHDAGGIGGEDDGSRGSRGKGDAGLTPLAAGAVAADVMMATAHVETQLRRAFASAAVGGRGGSDPSADVVWVDGGNELLVRPSKLRVITRTGFALVVIAVHTQETGNAEVVVPFALGSADDPLGLVAATETVPRGPDIIVETWGNQLIATAWDALLRVAMNAASGSGVDEDHQPLIPLALIADEHGLRVTPQARHQFDRVPQ